MNRNIRSHVEAHASALMRQQKLDKATLYINQGPCPGKRSASAVRGEGLRRSAPIGRQKCIGHAALPYAEEVRRESLEQQRRHVTLAGWVRAFANPACGEAGRGCSNRGTR